MVVGEDFWLRIPMNNESAGRHLCMDDVEVIHAWLESGYGGCWTLPLETDGEQLEGVAVKVPGSRLGLGTYAVVMAGKFVNGGHFRTKRQLFIRLVDREEQADAKPTMFNEEKAYWAGPAVLSGMLSRDGLNTYELAVLHGYDGTLEQFLAQAGIELQDFMVTKAKLSREVQTQLDKGSEKAINPAGDYDAEAEYSVNEMVYDEETNSSYVSKQSVNVGHAVTDTDWWMKVLDGNYVHTTIQAIMTAAQETLDEAKQDTIDATAAALAAKQDTEQATAAANAVVAQKVADAQIGYYVCETAAGTATKATTTNTIGQSTFAVPVKGCIVKVKMANANTATDTVYLQFGSDANTKKELKYNGLAVDASNTWEEGEVISVYYDGTYYQASNAMGQVTLNKLTESKLMWEDTNIGSFGTSYGILDSSQAEFINVTNTKYTHIILPVPEGMTHLRVTTDSNASYFGFVTAYNLPQTDPTAYYCEGTARISQGANKTTMYVIPSTCHYIIFNIQGNNNFFTPSSVELGKIVVEETGVNANDISQLKMSHLGYKVIGLGTAEEYPNHPGIMTNTTFIIDSKTRWHRVIERDIKAKTLKVTANANANAKIAFAKSYTEPEARGELIDLCTSVYKAFSIAAGETKEFLIPDDCTHIIVNRYSSDTTIQPSNLWFGYDNTATLDALDEIKGEQECEYDTVTGTWDTAQGTLMRTTESARKATDYIEVGNAEYICKEANGLSNYYALFYDSDKNYIGFTSYEVVDNKVIYKVLPGAYYFTNNLTTSSEDVKVVKFKLYGKKEEVAAKEEGIDVRLSDFMNQLQTDQQNIEDCLAFVSGFGKKTIHFDVERLTVSRAILLESNTTILLEDCVIKQADETFDNVFRSANLNPNGNGGQDMPSEIPILENIKIIGVGKANIIGPDVNASSGGSTLVGDAYGFRTWQICMVRVNGFELSNIAFTKTRCWCITFELCENVSVHDLSIRSNVKNGDGIDFRVGCKHCEVYNMFASTTDDAVACTALGTLAEATGDYCGKPTWRLWPTLINANPSSLDIEDISVKDIYFSQTVNSSLNGGHGMICLSAYGSKVHNVSIDRFNEVAVGDNNNDGLIKIYHGYGSGYTAGDLNTIRLNDIVCTHFPYTLQVTGGIVEDVRANKLVNNASGGSTVSVSSGNVIGENVIVTNS